MATLYKCDRIGCEYVNSDKAIFYSLKLWGKCRGDMSKRDTFDLCYSCVTAIKSFIVDAESTLPDVVDCKP